MKGGSDRPLPWTSLPSHEAGNLWHIMAADGTPVGLVYKKGDVNRILDDMNGGNLELIEARATRSAVMKMWKMLHDRGTTREQLLEVVRGVIFSENME